MTDERRTMEGLGAVVLGGRGGMEHTADYQRAAHPLLSVQASTAERWTSLPCVEFAPRESSLVQAGGGSLAPLFYESDVCVADIARISQVPYPEEQAHAPSAITLKGGSTFFCTLTRQQLRKRLGIFVEEVAS